MPTDLDALKQTDIFADLPEVHLEHLAQRVQHRSYERNETIFKQGSPGNALFIVEAGEVKIAVKSGSDKEFTLAVHGPGRVFGELALLDGERRSAAAIAIGPTRCLIVYRDDFLELVESEPTAIRAVLGSLAGIIRRTNQEIQIIVGRDAHYLMARAFVDLQRRYGRKTDEGVLLERSVTAGEIASLTGLHTGVVSGLLRDYQYKYLIQVTGDVIMVLQPATFERWLELTP